MTLPVSTESVSRLRAAGLRVTAPRLAVLAALAPSGHLEVESIAAAARSQLGSLSTQAVYEILRAFAAAGLVRRIEPAGYPALFEARAGDNHHHLVCRSCGTIRDVDCVVGARPCLTPDDSAGFIIDESEVTFWGLCRDCARAAGSDSTGSDSHSTTDSERGTAPNQHPPEEAPA